MSETTTLLKVGATDLVLRMIEAGVVMRDLTLENPIRAIREISHDMTGRAQGPAGQRPRGVARWRSSASTSTKAARLRRPARRCDAGHASGCSTCGSAR